MTWYYIKGDEKVGPFSEAAFAELIAKGMIRSDTMIWNESMTDWVPFEEVDVPVPTESVVPAVQDGSVCSMCGQSFAENDLIPFENAMVCAGCKPTFIQQMKENAELSGKAMMRYAGFWRRWGAVFIDGLVMIPLTLPLNLGFQFAMGRIGQGKAMIPLAIVLYLLMLIIPAIYWVWMHGKCGATVGKKAMGIKVVLSDGSPISYGRAIGRYFSYLLSAMIMYIGLIMVGFDDEKRALHDHMCNTRVIFN